MVGRFARLAEWGRLRVWRNVVALTFRGSRAELEVAVAVRLQAAVVFIFLAVRVVLLGQVVVDLVLAGGWYSREGLAVVLGAACFVESGAFAAVTVRARRMLWGAVLADAAFGVLGLAAMSVAADPTPGRAGSLNWMLPYTVATATALGIVQAGDLTRGVNVAAYPAGADDVSPVSWVAAVRRAARGRQLLRLWPGVVALGLACSYVASASLPHRLAGDHAAQIWGNAANYLVFFAVGVVTLMVLRRRLAVMAARNAEVSRAAGELAREAQWRAVAVDVFGPVVALLDRVANTRESVMPASVRVEADRLIALIDAVRPGDAGGAGE